MKDCFLKILVVFSAFLPCLIKSEPIKSNFCKDCKGWITDFTDYPEGEEAFYELAWGWENLPTETVSMGSDAQVLTKGLFLSGNNHSDDLFMFCKRQINGLQPNTVYSLMFSVIIESNIPSGSIGIGGSPGESVYFKVGASTEEPKKICHQGFYHLNVDKGNQAMGGENALVVGDLANELVDPGAPQYIPKKLHNEFPLAIKSDPNGQLWIFLGTDSGYEGSTKFYIAEVVLTLEMVE